MAFCPHPSFFKNPYLRELRPLNRNKNARAHIIEPLNKLSLHLVTLADNGGSKKTARPPTREVRSDGEPSYTTRGTLHGRETICAAWACSCDRQPRRGHPRVIPAAKPAAPWPPSQVEPGRAGRSLQTTTTGSSSTTSAAAGKGMRSFLPPASPSKQRRTIALGATRTSPPPAAAVRADR